MPSLLQRAVTELHIDVPVYRCDLDEETHTVALYLYGGRVAHWTPPEYTDPQPVETPTPRAAGNPGTTRSLPRSEAQGETAKQPVKPVATDPTPSPPIETADFTIIPGVGTATAADLYNAGYHTFDDLDRTDDFTLSQTVKAYTLTKIRAYLKAHCP